MDGSVGSQMELILGGMGLKFIITFLIGTLIFWGLIFWTLKSIGTKLSLLWAFIWIVGLPLFYYLKIPIMFHLAVTAVLSIFMTIQLKYYGEV